MYVIAMACVSVAAWFVLLARVFGWRWLIKRSVIVDISLTGFLGLAFMGTLTGMLIAVTAGLISSVVLSAAKFIERKVTNV